MKKSIKYHAILFCIAACILVFLSFSSAEPSQAASLPSSYDLRDVNGVSYVTSIKDQGNFVDCWAFSAMAALESNLLINGYGEYDLSEMELAYNYCHTPSPCRPGTEKDRTILPDIYGTYLDIGLTSGYQIQLLANGYGCAPESAAPYPTTARPPKTLSVSWKDDIITLRNAYRISSLNHMKMKQYIMKYGAGELGVVIAQGAKRDDDYWNFDHNSYYLDTMGLRIYSVSGYGYGHDITVVGWDDNYSRENFGGSHKAKPTHDGAWLCRNSWGLGYKGCEDGYFWISYEDAGIRMYGECIFYEAELSGSNWKDIYQYDGTPSQKYVKAKSGSRAANVFRARSSSKLCAVGLTTYTKNQKVSIQLFRNPKNGKPESGKKLLNKSLTLTISEPGYRTVTLPSKYKLTRGDRFSVVVTYKTASGAKFKLPLDRNDAVPYDDTNNAIDYYSSSSPRQSYVRYKGQKWKDIGKSGHCNVRIKAYTN